jgi:DNA-binding NarL/FixJ family response regulator
MIITDDHPVVLRGLVALLSGHGEFEVVKSCANGTAGPFTIPKKHDVRDAPAVKVRKD